MNRKFLDGLPQGVEKILIARVLDCCDIVSERQQTKFTDFLDPFHRDFVRPLVGNYFGVRFSESGGYPDAEYQRLAIYPDYLRPDDIEFPINLLEISLSDHTRHLSHRDYLGALLGLGIKRNMVGDILTFDGGAQVFAAEEISATLLSIDQINRLKATAVEVPPYTVKYNQEPVRTVSTTVASARLDSVLGAGLGTSRNRVVDLIKSEKVKVNWRQISQPSFQLNAGDVISVRGKGRVELAELGPETRKGRLKIIVKKYM
ncbi:MAG: hypothetical protein FH749_05945 [Firmicutes bacterium]|nr:hypothetical protein [Bacillota bacterium]